MYKVDMFKVKVPTMLFGIRGFSACRDGCYVVETCTEILV